MCWNLNPLMKIYFWIFQITVKAKQLQHFLGRLLARGISESWKLSDEKWHETSEDKTPERSPSLPAGRQPRSWRRWAISVHIWFCTGFKGHLQVGVEWKLLLRCSATLLSTLYKLQQLFSWEHPSGLPCGILRSCSVVVLRDHHKENHHDSLSHCHLCPIMELGPEQSSDGVHLFSTLSTQGKRRMETCI